jgi:hypothetical protein
VFGLLVDDDDDPRREEPFRERAADFEAGFARCTPATADAARAGLVGQALDAEIVLVAVACSIRAWKGRAGLDPRLARVVTDVLAAAGARTVVVLLSAPAALAGIEPAPRTLVAAWGDAPVCVRAAIDVVLSGGPLRGLDPSA